MKIKNAIFTVIALELIIGLVGIAMEGFTLEALHSTTRFSGRFSLLIFSCIFLFQKDKPRIEAILSPKYYLVFALAHGIHLLELSSYVYSSGTALIPIRVLGGFVAYLFIFIMPIMQRYTNDFFLARQNALENIYAFYLWLIFFLTYLPRVLGKLPNVGGYYYEFVALMAWVGVMLPLRVIGIGRIASAFPK